MPRETPATKPATAPAEAPPPAAAAEPAAAAARSTTPADDTAGYRTIGVAIPIPDPYGGELQRWRQSFGDPLAQAIPTHITLLPPTRVADSALGGLEEHLLAVARADRPFSIHLRGTATFRPVSPVVFVALREGIGDCERLERAVLDGPLKAEPRFPYHPHVTVAHDLADEVLDRAFKELADYDARFSVPVFSLYEHGRDGVWRPQRDFTLGVPRSARPAR